MHVLDLQFEFQMQVEFIGDNETDVYEVTFNRVIEDTCNPNGSKGVESYRLSSGALREMAIGCEALAKELRKHIND